MTRCATEVEQANGRLQQAKVTLAAEQQSQAVLERELEELNDVMGKSKAEYDRVSAETLSVRKAIEELQEEKEEDAELYKTVSEDLAAAEAGLAKDRATHRHALNAELEKARVALRERDVLIVKLKDQLVRTNGTQPAPAPVAAPAPVSSSEWSHGGSSDGGPTPTSAAALAAAEKQIQEASQVFGGFDSDPFAQASAPASTFGGEQEFVNAMPVLEEQHTGTSTISGSYRKTAPLIPGLRIADRDEMSDTGTIYTDFTAVSTEYETPRDLGFNEASMEELGSSIEVFVESISMKGIRRLNKPFVTLCVVDAAGHLLSSEQVTGALSVSPDGQLDTFSIQKNFVVPIPEDIERASGWRCRARAAAQRER